MALLRSNDLYLYSSTFIGVMICICADTRKRVEQRHRRTDGQLRENDLYICNWMYQSLQKWLQSVN